MTELEIRSLLDDFGMAWGERDLDRVMSCLSEQIVYIASVGQEPGIRAVGHQDVRMLIESMFALDQGAQAETSDLIVSGNTAFWKWKYTLSDGSIELGCDIFKFVKGKIMEKDAYRKVRS